MIWEDREIKKIIKELSYKRRKKSVSSKTGDNIIAPRFVFVCGKKETGESEDRTIRGTIVQYLENNTQKSDYGKRVFICMPIISENLYSNDFAEDLFSFEKMLAEISHKIIIPAESQGTFCELGAFTMNKECLKKLIVINENKVEYRDSFITQGPIKLIENQNEDNVVLYSNPFAEDISFVNMLESLIKEEYEIKINTDFSKVILKSLIYELSGIIEIFQPINSSEIEYLYKRIMGINNYTILNQSEHKVINIKKTVLLMEKMGIINASEDSRYTLNKRISCYNIPFSINRKEAMEYRIIYLNRLQKLIKK